MTSTAGIALAATYHPRGEVKRLERWWSLLQSAYDNLTIVLPPDATAAESAVIRALRGGQVHQTSDWSHGRYMALKLGYESGAGVIHYADLDRLLRWVETRPDEWHAARHTVMQADCLVLGRTAAAWATHPEALRQTEAISNGLFSRLLGQPLDLSAGSKGFSRRAAACLLANTQPGRAIGTDAEWIVVLWRLGFPVESLLVDGLDWEIPDQHQDSAADAERQAVVRAAYDADASRWALRVRIAQEIIEAGMDAFERPLVKDGF